MLRAWVASIIILISQILLCEFACAQELKASLNFIDVENGTAVLIDVGEYEILIDGGAEKIEEKATNNSNALSHYLRRTRLIDGPLELLIISEPDSTAYENVLRIIKNPELLSNQRADVEDGSTHELETAPIEVKQIWTLGRLEDIAAQYNKDRCRYTNRSRYTHFLEQLQLKYPDTSIKFVPDEFPTLLKSKTFSPIDFDSNFPGKIYLVSAGLSGHETRKFQCSVARNDASMVMAIEIFGKHIFFGGDVASGYAQDTGEISAGGKEEEVLSAITLLPWFSRVDLLIAPRRGSWNANSPAYVDYLSPSTVLFGASSQFGQPAKTVVENYADQGSAIYSTAHSAEGGRHHISCLWSATENLKCEYGTVKNDKLTWEGRWNDGEILNERELRRILSHGKREIRKNGRAAYHLADVEGFTELTDTDLFAADLSNLELSQFNFGGANLSYANFSNSNLSEAILVSANLDFTNFSFSNLSDATFQYSEINGLIAKEADFSGANISDVSFKNSDFEGAIFSGTLFNKIELSNMELKDAVFEPDNFSLTGISRAFTRTDNIDRINDLHTLRYSSSPAALQKVRKYFQDSGQKRKEADVIYAIQKSRQANFSVPRKLLSQICCAFVADFGRSPNRPLLIIFGGIPVFSLLYIFAVLRSKVEFII